MLCSHIDLLQRGTVLQPAFIVLVFIACAVIETGCVVSAHRPSSVCTRQRDMSWKCIPFMNHLISSYLELHSSLLLHDTYACCSCWNELCCVRTSSLFLNDSLRTFRFPFPTACSHFMPHLFFLTSHFLLFLIFAHCSCWNEICCVRTSSLFLYDSFPTFH